jgi:hypothetical protein
MEEKNYVYNVYGTWEFGNMYRDTFETEEKAQKYIDEEFVKERHFEKMYIQKIEVK